VGDASGMPVRGQWAVGCGSSAGSGQCVCADGGRPPQRRQQQRRQTRRPVPAMRHRELARDWAVLMQNKTEPEFCIRTSKAYKWQPKRHRRMCSSTASTTRYRGGAVGRRGRRRGAMRKASSTVQPRQARAWADGDFDADHGFGLDGVGRLAH
jgi:hypothetical protein